MIGSVVIFFNKKANSMIISCLSFAAGVMICVSVIDLIPESFKLINSYLYPFPTILTLLIFFSLGVIISMIIDYFFPSSNEIYRVGIISLIAIVLHNIPEGIATFITTTDNQSLGLNLTIAIALHNIPEGICIALPIYYVSKSRGVAIFYTLISALSEPFGALLAFLFLTNFVSSITLGMLYSIIAGIMIHISVYELIPLSLKYKKHLLTVGSFIVGFIIMLCSIFI